MDVVTGLGGGHLRLTASAFGLTPFECFFLLFLLLCPSLGEKTELFLSTNLKSQVLFTMANTLDMRLRYKPTYYQTATGPQLTWIYRAQSPTTVEDP